jgi:class 3 adenylate cyclase
LVAFYNDYMEILGRPLSDHQGVLDKFIGTVVMGFWGPPFTREEEHAGLALKTAGDLIASLPKLESLLQDHLGESFNEGTHKITIGVATGDIIVGNMGSTSSVSYTVMGDVVNNASRLKGATKQYGVPFLCSTETVEQTDSDYQFRELDEILAVGMDEPMKVYEYLPNHASYSAYDEISLALYSQGLAAYRQGDWAGAKQPWNDFAVKVPNDKAVQVMLARLPNLEAAPPVGWSGVWQMKDK